LLLVGAMDEQNPADAVRTAVDDLLQVVSKAADDLRLFHETVSHARLATPPRYPRVSVSLTASIIDRLQKVEEELAEVLRSLTTTAG
jgi:hypothetical protein